MNDKQTGPNMPPTIETATNHLSDEESRQLAFEQWLDRALVELQGALVQHVPHSLIQFIETHRKSL